MATNIVFNTLDEYKTLYIIAGPNGGGKSTYSKDIVPNNISIFDGDALFKNYSKYCDEDYLAWQNVYNYFEEQIEYSIKNNLSFAYESNFFQSDSIDIPQRFKDAGYKLECHFIALSNIDLCIHRVTERVKLGGHSVPENQIIKRYNGGLDNLKNHFLKFNNLVIYLNDSKLTAIFYLEENQLSFIDSSIIDNKSDISKIINYIQKLL